MAKRMVRMHDTIEPNVGMKFARKAIKPKTGAKSRERTAQMPHTHIPVIRELTNLIEI